MVKGIVLYGDVFSSESVKRQNLFARLVKIEYFCIVI